MHAHANAYACIDAHPHIPHDKIKNVLRGRVQDLTMWESDLLFRVCSGCCCNQHIPKA